MAFSRDQRFVVVAGIVERTLRTCKVLEHRLGQLLRRNEPLRLERGLVQLQEPGERTRTVIASQSPRSLGKGGQHQPVPRRQDLGKAVGLALQFRHTPKLLVVGVRANVRRRVRGAHAFLAPRTACGGPPPGQRADPCPPRIRGSPKFLR
jgi:hypothetical protein